MEPLLVLYHKDCVDGWCSAWLFKKAYKDAELIEVGYHDTDIPDVAGRDVCVVDFSYPQHIADEMYARAKSFLILDHHATALHDLANRPYFRYSATGCGCALVFEYLSSKMRLIGKMPWMIPYIQDQDLWKWEIENSRPVNAYIRSVPRTVKDWNSLASSNAGVAKRRGDIILSAEEMAISAQAKTAHLVILDGQVMPAVCTSAYHSQTAAYLLKINPWASASLVYRRVPSGMWLCSIRGRVGGATVVDIAEKFGGGGHPWGAGFTLEYPPEMYRGEHPASWLMT